MRLLKRLRKTPSSKQAWLVVGLGNPSETYASTRHNAGARAAERLAEQLGATMKPAKAPALVAETRLEDTQLLVARTSTYMNESGRGVSGLLRYYKVEGERLIVIHDDLDLEAGVLRIKKGGGTAGHHGLEDIVRLIGSKDFYRVRIGVGRPPSPRQDPADFLLEPMGSRVTDEMAVAERRAADAVIVLIEEGLERAMNRFNG